MRYFIRLFLLMLVVFAQAPLAYATVDDVTPWYQVEIIVFDDVSAQGLSAENWPSHPALPAVSNTIQLQAYDPANPNQNYELVPKTDWQLKSQAAQLRQQKPYHILLHLAWRQQIDTPRNAKAIHIYTKPIKLPMPSDIHQLSAYDPQETWQINGTVKISKTNYFNVGADLVLNLSRKALSPYLNNAPIARLFSERNLASFRLMQTRRMRESEIHYFDHPLFGMLMKITPIKIAPPVIASAAKQSRNLAKRTGALPTQK